MKALAAEGITTMDGANRYMREVYISAWNQEFPQPAREPGSAFVPCCEGDRLDDILMAVRHGKRVPGRYDAEGQLLQGAARVAESGLRYSGPSGYALQP